MTLGKSFTHFEPSFISLLNEGILVISQGPVSVVRALNRFQFLKLCGVLKIFLEFYEVCYRKSGRFLIVKGPYNTILFFGGVGHDASHFFLCLYFPF